MHQEAGSRKPEAEQTKEVAVPATVEKGHDALAKAAEKELRVVRRTFTKRVEAAARQLDKAQKPQARRLYRGKGVLLFEDRIETSQGTARFAKSLVEATVHFAASAQEPQVIVDTPDFVSVLPSRPGKAGKLANVINQAAWIAPEIAAKHALAISAARAQLERAERERDEQVRAGESRLEAARGGFEPPGVESSG
jgi:hypothetical protein